MTKNIINQEYNKFLTDLKERVASSRYKAALSVNKELILLYHHIGTQILEAQNKAGWGAKVFKYNTSPGQSLYFLDPDDHKLEIHVGNWKSRIDAKKANPGNWKNVEWFV
jgi:DUF1016 N-terminal domain